MPRFKSIHPATATGRTRELLDGVEQTFGVVPNITRLMANSPQVLEGYLEFARALAGGLLTPQLRELISIAVASENGCDYCLSAHAAAGKMMGLRAEEIADAKTGESTQEKEQAALDFALKLVRNHGWVADEDLSGLRNVGFGEAEIIEIIGTTVLNIFTNYFNHVAETEIDFPLAKKAVARV